MLGVRDLLPSMVIVAVSVGGGGGGLVVFESYVIVFQGCVWRIWF